VFDIKNPFFMPPKEFLWSLVMGLGQKFLTPGQVESTFCGSGRVSHLWFGFEIGKFPLQMSNFSIFFPSDQKKSLRVGQKVPAGRPLIYCRSKVSLGWVRAHLYYELIWPHSCNLVNLNYVSLKLTLMPNIYSGFQKVWHMLKSSLLLSLPDWSIHYKEI